MHTDSSPYKPLVLVHSAFGLDYPKSIPPYIQMVGAFTEDFSDNTTSPDIQNWLETAKVLFMTCSLDNRVLLFMRLLVQMSSLHPTKSRLFTNSWQILVTPSYGL